MLKILIKISALVLLLFFINSWVWTTHQNIAVKIVGSFPELNLNISLVKEGSIAPDKDFSDFKYHSYPYTLNKSIYWINKTKYFYQINDINNASYSFGVLTHYISDTFAAPHTVQGEQYSLHSKFEEQVKYYFPNTECQDFDVDLKEELEKSKLNSDEWYLWLNTRDKEIPKKEVEQSVKLIYPVALEIFNLKCKNSVKINKSNYLSKEKLALILIIFLIISLIVYSMFRNAK